jgi:hypothetical protein
MLAARESKQKIEPEAKQDYKFGFIVLLPIFNIKQIQDTLRSIRIYYPNHPMVIACSSQLTKEQIKIVQSIDLQNKIAAKRDQTICGIINSGVKSTTVDWNFIFVAGAKIKTKIERKYLSFAKSDKDILYAVINRKTLFYESSLNGLFFHKRALNEIGDMPTEFNDIEGSKIVWFCENIVNNKQFTFKGVINVPIIG